MDPLSQMFKSAMEMDRSAVVICDLQHTIVYMNPVAIEKYEKWGGEAHTHIITRKRIRMCIWSR